MASLLLLEPVSWLPVDPLLLLQEFIMRWMQPLLMLLNLNNEPDLRGLIFFVFFIHRYRVPGGSSYDKYL